ncbi:hypothetical protein Ac2012v2_007960 [Leucoagaricus gongylophorus]
MDERCYRVLSPHIEARVNNVGEHCRPRQHPQGNSYVTVWDPEHKYMFLDIQQWFKLFNLPIKPAPARLCTRLTLQRGTDGLYYIAMQEDFYHPDDFMALLLPPLVPFIRMVLLIAGLTSSLFASFSHFFGFWMLDESNNNESRPDGFSEEDLYNDQDRRY